MESGPHGERRSAELFTQWVELCGGVVEAPGAASANAEVAPKHRFLPLQMLDRSDPGRQKWRAVGDASRPVRRWPRRHRHG